MAVILRRLYQKVSYLNMQLIAGENGLDNLVRWIHPVESREVVPFVEEGEVVFTTGLGLTEDFDLLKLVKGVEKRGAAGIVLNTGPYIGTIDSEITEFADQKKFPVFQVPWQVHMPEIIKIFSFDILREEQNNMELVSAVKNAVFCHDREESYVGTFMQYSYMPEWNYCTALLEILQNNMDVTAQRLEQLFFKLERHVLHLYKNTTLFIQDKRIFLLMCNYTAEMEDALFDELGAYIQTILSRQEQCFFSAGKTTRSVRCIYKSYEQAEKIAALIRHGSLDIVRNTGNCRMLQYQKLGIYKLLLAVHDREIIEDYIRDTVGPLYDYDSANDSDIAVTLRCYISHSGSVKDTAEELYIHRNTVNYKIKKAEEILGCSLQSLDSRTKINIGFMLYNIHTVYDSYHKGLESSEL